MADADMMLSSQDKKVIQTWAQQQTDPVTLRLARGDGPADRSLTRFCDAFSELVPVATIKPAPDEPFRAPAVIIGRHGNIAYQAVPAEKELPVFLEALRLAGNNGSPPVEAKDTRVNQIELPVQLTVFIAPQCPHCPQVVSRLIGLAHENPPLRLSIVDGVLFDQKAKAHDIRSVPTLLLDNDLRWTGQIDIQEVLDQCVRRDPAHLSAASLRQIIEAGEAERLAAMMRDSQRIFPALVQLLTHERWSVRLGAMVTVEYLADTAPKLSGHLLDLLWDRFEGLSETIQGDLVQVIGSVPINQARHYLQRISTGNFPETVKEAAAEELASPSD